MNGHRTAERRLPAERSHGATTGQADAIPHGEVEQLGAPSTATLVFGAARPKRRVVLPVPKAQKRRTAVPADKRFCFLEPLPRFVPEGGAHERRNGHTARPSEGQSPRWTDAPDEDL